MSAYLDGVPEDLKLSLETFDVEGSGLVKHGDVKYSELRTINLGNEQFLGYECPCGDFFRLRKHGDTIAMCDMCTYYIEIIYDEAAEAASEK